MPPLTPDELLVETQAAIARRVAEAEEARRIKRQQIEAAAQANLERLDDYIYRIESAMRSAAQSGLREVRVTLVSDFDGYDKPEWQPLIDALNAHFKDAGFSAIKPHRQAVGSFVFIEEATDYYRGEPGPGPSNIEAEIAW